MGEKINEGKISRVADTIRPGSVLKLSRELIRIPSIYRQEKELAEHIAGTLEGLDLRWCP